MGCLGGSERGLEGWKEGNSAFFVFLLIDQISVGKERV